MPKRYTPNDVWSKKATEEGYRARSVYKLQELDEKFRLLKPGMTVLDLGACPGSWMQYTAEKIGRKGKAIGLDLTTMEPIADNVSLHTQDITDTEGVQKILEKEGVQTVDLVLSDLAPKTSGIKDVDQWRSIELSQSVVEVAKECLKPKGACVMKVFRGEDFDEFFAELKEEWDYVHVAIAKASRDRSREVYIVMRKR